MNRIRAVMWVCCVLVVAPSLADEGRIPIFEPVVLDGSVADIGGRYVVTRDITAPDGARAIKVVGTGDEEITIDLNGFTLTGNSQGQRAIEIISVKKIVIRNGTLKTPLKDDPLIAIELNDAIDDQVIIEDIRFSKGYHGIDLSGVSNVVFRRNFVVDTLLDGLVIFPTTHPVTGTIEDNTFRNVADPTGGGAAISVLSASIGLTVRNNRISSNYVGIFVQSSTSLLLSENSILAGGFRGLDVVASTGCRLVNNAVTSATQYGIRISTTHNCLIRDNVSQGNGNGIVVEAGSSRNHIDRNIFNDNADFGLYLVPGTTGNRYGRNSAAGNGGVSVCVNSGTATCGAPEVCDEGGNLSFGDNLIPGPGPC